MNLVCCICPTHRPEFLKEAQEVFANQTYPMKTLFVLPNKGEFPIGAFRNQVIAKTPPGCIIAHLDDDDWSSPHRIAEQVAFLESSKASIVGYRDMPFYDVRTQRVTFYKQPRQNYALGTSLMYWRSVWEQHPFIETEGDEDARFQRDVGHENVATQSSVINVAEPRMFARIHPGNTSPKGGARYEKASPGLESEVRRIVSMALHTVRKTA